MSTAPTTAPPAAGPPVRKPKIFAFSAVLAALSLFWMATEQHYSACVESQVARYPAVGVSAYYTEDTGPIKASYDTERRGAVNKCKRFIVV